MDFESAACAPFARLKYSDSVMPLIIIAPLIVVNSDARIPLFSKVLKNQGVQKIEQIYRLRLQILVDEAGTQAALSRKIDKAPAQISQWINASKDSKTGKPRAMDRATAREIERAADKPDGWMDQPLDGVMNTRFSPELQEKISELSDDDIRQCENALRGLVALPMLPLLSKRLAA